MPTADTSPGVSLVITVLNEAASLDPLLASLAAQTCPPAEIIVVDGGSTDGTLDVLARWRERLPLRVLCRPGANISAGRNAGIAAATGAIVAVTDAGVRLAPDWLACLLAPFDAVAGPDAPDIVAGFFAPDPQTPFEIAMGATVLPTLDDIAPATFLPSSRSIAFRRMAWAAAGGYPEWLDYCEDLVFDLRLREQGARFAFAPQAIARFRPRGSLRAFWRQYYQYARGDGKAGLFARRHAVRYGTYAGLAWFVLRGWRLPLLWPLLLLGGAAYLRRPYARLAPALPALAPGERAGALLAVPLIRLVGDGAKMAGYPVGLRWRWRRYGRRASWRTIGGQPRSGGRR
ncbi:MAG TPA: glycosyltransferase [Thermomicrobiales bacterium]|nr:glycosyltransferase [Thermomicrobiales bacterium]